MVVYTHSITSSIRLLNHTQSQSEESPYDSKFWPIFKCFLSNLLLLPVSVLGTPNYSSKMWANEKKGMFHMLFNDFIKSLVGKGRIVNTSTLGLGPGPSNGSPRPGFLRRYTWVELWPPLKAPLKTFFLIVPH